MKSTKLVIAVLSLGLVATSAHGMQLIKKGFTSKPKATNRQVVIRAFWNRTHDNIESTLHSQLEHAQKLLSERHTHSQLIKKKLLANDINHIVGRYNDALSEYEKDDTKQNEAKLHKAIQNMSEAHWEINKYVKVTSCNLQPFREDERHRFDGVKTLLREIGNTKKSHPQKKDE